MLDDLSPFDAFSFTEKLKDLLEDLRDRADSLWKPVLKTMIRILCILVLCGLAECFDQEGLKRIVLVAGSLAIVVTCTADMKSLIGLGLSTMDEISSFSSLLLPVMTSAAAASGAQSGAAALYAVSVLFSGLFIRMLNGVFLPVLYAALALSVLDTILQDQRLQNMKSFCFWIVKTGLKTIMYVFTGFLSVSGILSGSTDAMRLKAAKITLSGMIPVVGGIVSDAADTVLTGANYLRSTIGAYGMIVVLAVFFVPFFTIGLQYLSFRLLAVLSGILGSKLMKLLESISDVMGYLLAMVGCSLVMCYLSCFSIMQVGK